MLVFQRQIGPGAATPPVPKLVVGELAKNASSSIGNFADNGKDYEAAVSPELFSEAWEEQYASGSFGCGLGRKRFTWRQCGFGSNILRE